MIAPTADGDVNVYNASSQLNKDKKVYFVNGMRVNGESHRLSALTLSCITEHPIIGVYNKTFEDFLPGLGWLDLAQCKEDTHVTIRAQIIEKVVDAVKLAVDSVLAKPLGLPSVKEMNESLSQMLGGVDSKIIHTFWKKFFEQQNPAAASLLELLLRGIDSKQWIVAHSQGNLICANALWALQSIVGFERMKGIRVYSLCSPVPFWPKGIEQGGQHKLYGYEEDGVTMIEWLGLTERSPGHWKSLGGAFSLGGIEHDFYQNVFGILESGSSKTRFADKIREHLGLPKLSCTCQKACSKYALLSENNAGSSGKPLGIGNVTGLGPTFSPQWIPPPPTIRTGANSRVAFLSEGDKILFKTDGSWNWSGNFDGSIALKALGDGVAMQSRKAIAEEDVLVTCSELAGRSYESGLFKGGTVGSGSMKITTGTQTYARIYGKHLATVSIEGTFSISVSSKAKGPNGSLDPVSTKSGKWLALLSGSPARTFAQSTG